MDKQEKEEKILNKINLMQIASIVLFFVGFLVIIANMIVLRKFNWYFLALVMVGAMMVSAIIVSIKKRIASNYKEAISKAFMQLMITLAFVLDVKFLTMCCNTAIKTKLAINANFLVLFNMILSIVFIVYLITMFIIVTKMVFKIIRPVLIKKKIEKMKQKSENN